MKSLRTKKTRRGLAPLEFVLTLPLLLFVMALFINAGASSAWKVRAQGAARDVLWRDRWPRRFEKPDPASWPDEASISTSKVDSVSQLGHQDIDQPVARGPMIGNAQVNRDLLDPTRGVRKGHSSIERQRPLLTKVGGNMKYNLDHPLLDRTWTYDQTNLDPNMPQPYRNDGHTAYEEHHGQTYQNIKQGLSGNYLRRIHFIYNFGANQVQGYAEYQRAVAETAAVVGAVRPLSYRLDPWEGAKRYGDPDFKRYYYEFGPIWDMVLQDWVSGRTDYGQPFPLQRPYYPFSVNPDPDGLDGYPEFHPQLRFFCTADPTEADMQARENVDRLVKMIKGDQAANIKPAPYHIANSYIHFYNSAIQVRQREIEVLRHNNDPSVAQKERELSIVESDVRPLIDELTEYRDQL